MDAMSTAFWSALQDHYPELERRMHEIADTVGNRQINFLAVLMPADELPQVEPVVRGALNDLVAAVLSAVAEGDARGPATSVLGTHVFLALLNVLELGVWLGQEGLASLRLEDVRRRVARVGSGASEEKRA